VRESAARPGFSGRGARERASRLAALGGVRKRAFDVVMAGIALMVMMPIMIVTAVLIRWLIGEPVVLAQDMIGLEGRVFAGYKFRTATGNAKGANLWAGWLSEALRGSSLDKLPLFFNVLRGDMSLVGPRPRATGEPHNFARAPECLLARPGLTGMWQGYSQKRCTQPEIALDRYYVRRWSMRLDFALLHNAISAAHSEDRTA
jgi:exopolysaccharide production protein ExoY